ncbi:putative inorganic phosphate cotransporter-like protein, partial [Dinothrombium tinctorium]
GGEFDWSPSLQGIVLSSYFYGYISTQIVGGRWAEKWGAKWVCGIGVLGSSVFSLLAPISAKFVLLFCAVRAVVGVFHGLVFSSLFRLLSLWLPANERGSVVAFVFAAGQFAGVYTLPLVSFLCESNFLGGWPSAFYIFGLSGCLLSLIWFLYITDKPDDHPQISEAELQFIQKGVEKSDKSKMSFTDELIFVASFGPCICLMIVPFVGCNKNYVITLLVISMFLYGFCGGGELLIVADFAPNFSGTIFGIANLFTILSAILGPSIVGWLLNENVSRYFM